MKLLTSRFNLLLAIALSSLMLSATIVGQQTPTPPKVQPVPDTSKSKEKEKVKVKPGMPMPELPPGVEMGDGTTTERSIAVDQKVSIQMCVTQGNVRINGWSRNEVRAFVSEGSTFGFHIGQKSMKDGNPVLISLVNVRKTPNGVAMAGDCIAGDEVELDVPVNAAISLKGRQADIDIDGVRKIWVKNVGGDINIRNVSQGVSASTFQGDVTVENSSGMMELGSSSGNIVAYGVEPAEVGDQLKAQTNSGAISLQKVGYRLADVNSISGTVLFSGTLLSGGSFSFKTTNGSIRLMLPEETSCRVTAIYGSGSFDSGLPLKTLTSDMHPGPIKTINGTIGAGGDANLRVETSMGSIQIRKLQP